VVRHPGRSRDGEEAGRGPAPGRGHGGLRPAALSAAPQLPARISIAGEAAPAEISAETVAGVEAALQGAGFAVRVTSMGEP